MFIFRVSCFTVKNKTESSYNTVLVCCHFTHFIFIGQSRNTRLLQLLRKKALGQMVGFMIPKRPQTIRMFTDISLERRLSDVDQFYDTGAGRWKSGLPLRTSSSEIYLQYLMEVYIPLCCQLQILRDPTALFFTFSSDQTGTGAKKTQCGFWAELKKLVC